MKKKHKTNLGLISDKELLELTYKEHRLNKSKWKITYFEKADEIVEEYENTDFCSCHLENDSILITLGSSYFRLGNKMRIEIKNDEIKAIRFNEKYHYNRYASENIKWDDLKESIKKKNKKISYVPIAGHEITFLSRPKWELGELIIGHLKVQTKPFDPVNKFPLKDEKLVCIGEILFKCELKKLVRMIKD